MPPPTRPAIRCLADWTTPDEVPPFDRIKPEHFRPAYARALAEHEAEIAAITADPAPPSFDNTIAALELAGRALARVGDVFHLLTGAHTNDALLEIEREISPQMARHWNKINTNAALFAPHRCADARHRQARPRCRAEARAGALSHRLPPRRRRRSTTRRRSGSPRSSSGLPRLAPRSARTCWPTSRPSRSRARRRSRSRRPARLRARGDEAAAQERGSTAMWSRCRAPASSRSCNSPRAATCARRSSAPSPCAATTAARPTTRRSSPRWCRCAPSAPSCSAYPTSPITGSTTPWRRRRPRCASCSTRSGRRRGKRALADRDAMQELIAEEGGNFKLAAWDWRYYAEKLRKRRCDFDEIEHQAVSAARSHDRGGVLYRAAAVRPDASRRARTCRSGIPTCGSGRCAAATASEVGLFFGDYFARPSKRSGAWMTSLRDQEKLAGDIRPLILNVMQLRQGAGRRADAAELRRRPHAVPRVRPRAARPSLRRHLSDDLRHQRRHRFRRAAVAALRALAGAARGAAALRAALPRPASRCRRSCCSGCIAARNFNMGFATVEYVASALVDLDFHSLPSAEAIDVNAFETKSLARIGMPDEIVMRHRPPHFTHVFSGGGYAAAYYSYMWSEVLDADAFAAFEETGDIFDPATAKRLHDTIYSAGGSRIRPSLQGVPRPAADRRRAAKKRGFTEPARGTEAWPTCTAPAIAAASSARRTRPPSKPAAPILAEGGNALEAMVAMAATIAAVYPHMNHLGGDGFWLIREPSGRVRAIMARRSGRRATRGRSFIATTRPIPPRGPLAALTVPGAIGGWMLALRGREGATAASCRSMCCWQRHRPRPRRLSGHAQPGAAHGKPSGRAQGRAGLCRDVSGRRQAAGGRHHAEAAGARRDARTARPCRPRRFLSRRCRARDRRRSRTHRQPGHARRS